MALEYIAKQEAELPAIEQARLRISRATGADKKSQLGQFFTPARIAQFMVSLFSPSQYPDYRVLDPGAGIGSLSAAFLEQLEIQSLFSPNVRLTACEIDSALQDELRSTLSLHLSASDFDIISTDFIPVAVENIQNDNRIFTHAILNPPYKKINSKSKHRLLLREVGIETVNLYTAFVALTLDLLATGGQMVAIIPRSFCNGPYYKPFREFMPERSAIEHIHLFSSRSKAFKDDEVLQENIIIKATKGKKQGGVTITTSTDDSFRDIETNIHPFDRIVLPGDKERFIHIPTSTDQNIIEQSSVFDYSPSDLGIKVSTGPVVDFRVKEHLRDMPGKNTAPLLYPGHFKGNTTDWPLPEYKKPNAIFRHPDTDKWLYPNGFYCVVRRFSSKEEARRVVASVVDPSHFGDSEMLGFENHLNVFHDSKTGISKTLAWGLATYLNSSPVDGYFRRFNGHTQVNATDLKSMKYPSLLDLEQLGQWAISKKEITQEDIDRRLEELVQ